jgi:predicted CopG family antitoxin
MQISLNIQDDVYQKLKSAGIDMQSKINEYLLNLVDKKDDYLNSKQFQEDRAYFHEALEDIESGKTKPLSHTEIWNTIEQHTTSN